jgi:branched-chain amino acid aminotransferase
MGLEVVERKIDRSEIFIADECLLTGTAAHITPVVEVDHRKIGGGNEGPVGSALQELYFDIVRGKNSKYLEWCTAVTPDKR